MSRNGSGTYSQPVNTAAVANQTASSTAFNDLISDMSTALTESINKDGTKAFAAAQSMGGFKLTSLADGTLLTDAANLKLVQNDTLGAVDGGGTADAITATYSPAITAVVDKMRLRVEATAANATTTPTFAPNGLTARTIKKLNGAALAIGDIAGDGHTLDLEYHASSTYWNLLNPANSQASASLTVSGIVELATTTETLTGTDATRAVTPDGLAALWEKGSDVASSGTTSLGEGGFFHITGTTTITDIDFATAKDGRSAVVVFDGVLTLTHNGTTLVLPGAQNILTAAGDTACFVQDSSDNVICVWYRRASGLPLLPNIVRKSADETVSASTTFQDDDHLLVPVLASTNYWIEFNIMVAAATVTGGLKAQLTGPAAPTEVQINGHLSNGNSGTESQSATAFSSSMAWTANLAATAGILRIFVLLRNGANAGTVTLQWAQNTASGAASFKRGSYVTYQVIA